MDGQQGRKGRSCREGEPQAPRRCPRPWASTSRGLPPAGLFLPVRSAREAVGPAPFHVAKSGRVTTK